MTQAGKVQRSGSPEPEVRRTMQIQYLEIVTKAVDAVCAAYAAAPSGA